jgi:cytidylate kinase
MTIITISRGSYSMGKEVAERLAKRLGFECLSRDVLLEASDKFNIPEIKLVNAIIDTPSFLSRLAHGQLSYISYIQSALTRHVCKDNVVYHGLAGHVFLRNVPHVLKVCIIADLERRAAVLMERENMNEREAKSWITKVDKERRKWTRQLYGIDPRDPSLYDIVIKIGKFDIDDAVEAIFQSARLPHFQATKESQRGMEDLALVGQYPGIKVSSMNGNVLLYADPGKHERKLKNAAEKLRSKVKGISNIEIHAGVSPPKEAV